jgi:hypothetical protein|tara:strand:- start:2540 stop:2998 length:459 start_codon:yes stop_codon:yes gene_type:complete
MANAESNKIPRDATTRAASNRPQSWQPAALLPEPDKQPGYEYKWVRVSSLGKADPSNVSAKLREGWEAVLIEEQPKFSLFADPDSRFKNNIEVGGLLLCKIPTEFVEQRKAFYGNKNKAQMDSVDNNFMRENNPVMPLFKERKSTSSFGNGK